MLASGSFPVTPGTQYLYQLKPGGHVSVVASNLTFPTAMTCDPDGEALYGFNYGFGVPCTWRRPGRAYCYPVNGCY